MSRMVFSRQLLFVILLGAVLSYPVCGQKRERVVQWSIYHAPGASSCEPLQLLDVKVKGEPVQVGRPFAADDDWLSGLTFRLKNVSGSPFVNLRMAITFPETADNTGILGYALFDIEMAHRARTRAPKTLGPGEEIELTLSSGRVRMLNGFVIRRGLNPNLTRVLITNSLVVRYEQGGEHLCSFRRGL